MGLDNHGVELVQDSRLVLRVFAEGEDEVLGRHTACLRPSEEEREYLIDNAHFTLFEMVIDEQDSQKVTFFGKFRVSLQLNFPLADDCLAEGSEGFSVATLVALKRRDVVPGEPWEEHDMWHAHSID
eukprot:CAMPEP_0170464424 /NCGR_PEP_ID=MMETSP0123-20130129/9159_1 /TAXON_ID=182087 /ORGANISM="Favella ehrenbergii, Strain Fehren 1" /LENGTH=126 /DNA_ID=CAMNT_0010730089 /DNA_START=629 /DNA_END=1009 /DNA_ORIENTATION=+